MSAYDSKTEYEVIINTSLEHFVKAASVLGEPLTSLAAKVKQAFIRQFELINFGLINREPSNDEQVRIMFLGAVGEVANFREEPNSEFANHVRMIREAIQALGWILVRPTPGPYIKDFHEAGIYYSNRVLKDNKGKAEHVNFVNKWNDLIDALYEYVRKNYRTGFLWGQGGGNDFAPPPPPPPPQMEFGALGESNSAHSPNRQALLNELNQGSNITRQLKPAGARHVGKSALTAQTPAQQVPPANAPGAVATPPRGPPKFALEGRKYVVENFDSPADMITVTSEDKAYGVSIYRCSATNIQVKGKINGMTIDACQKSNIEMDDVISSVELINCRRVKIQCNGDVKTIQLDNCDTCDIYLKKAALGAAIITSKCTSLNICQIEESGNLREDPIPEQIKTIIVNGNLVNTVVEHF